MPAAILQQVVSVGPLAGGASVVIPHALVSSGIRLIPTLIWPDTPTPIGVVSADDQNVTFRNTSSAAAPAASFLVQFTHSFQQSASSPPYLYWRGNVAGATGTTFPSFLIALGDTQAIDVYVDSTDGDDDNDGLTPATALETVNGVYAKFPLWALGGATVTIHFAAGAGDTVAAYPVRTLVANGGDAAVNAYRYRGPQMVPATLTTGPTQVVGGLTITATGRRTQIDVAGAPGWTASNLRAKFLRIVRGGVKVVFEIPICENTASRIFVDDEKLAPLMAAGDTLEIVTPGARFISDAAFRYFITGTAGYLPAPGYWGTADASATFERMFFDDFMLAMNVGGLTFDRCLLTNFPFIKGGSIAHFNCIYPLSVKISCMSTEFGISGRADAAGDPINTTVAMELLALLNPLLIGNPDGYGQYMAKRNVSVYGVVNALRGAIHVVGGGSMFWADDGTLAPNGAVALQGSGNAGPFIWALHGAQVRIGTTAGATPLTTGTGTGSPLRVGQGAANPAIDYGVGAGAFEEVAGFNGNFTRVFAGTVAAPTGDGSRIFINP